MSEPSIRLALLAAHDRRGIVELAHELESIGYYIVSADATARELVAAGIKVVSVERLTATPDILGGAIRLLHPAVMAGITARRDRLDHMELLSTYRVGPVDFVAVNLAPPDPEGRPLLDLSGAAALLAGANNPEGVAVLSDPDDYPRALQAMRAGELNVEVRQGLAIKALAHVVERISLASLAMGGPALGGEANAPAAAASADLQPLAVLWQTPEGPEQIQLLTDVQERWLVKPTLALLLGQPLTAAQVIDADVAWGTLSEFGDALPAAIVSRSGVVCGAAAVQMSLAGAVLRAFDTDPLASHLAVVAVNRPVDLGAMRALLTKSLTLVVAPAFDDEAIELAATVPDLRLLTMGAPQLGSVRRQLRVTRLGVLQQDEVAAAAVYQHSSVLTNNGPDDAQLRALAIAWRIVAHQPGCSAVACDEQGAVGISSGLANVGDALVVAVGKCRRSYKPLAIAVDAPLLGRENLDPLVKGGIKALLVACDAPLNPEIVAAAETHGIRLMCVPRVPKI